MKFLLLLNAILLGFSSTQTSALLHSGKGTVHVFEEKEFDCKPFPFNPAMSSDDVRVQLSVRQGYYDTAVTWVESVSKHGFTACVSTSGLIQTRRIISLQWMAFEMSDLPVKGFAKVQDIPLWTTGTQCVFVDTGYKFTAALSTPFVFLTVIHTSPPKNKHDATSVWAEDVNNNNFKACVRELKNFDGVHSGVKLDILALESIPSAWSIPDSRKIEFINDYTPSGGTDYSFCREFTFAKQFYDVPVVITTARHLQGNTDADNNAITEWAHQVSTSSLDICLKDMQPYDAFHDPVTVNFLAIGNVNPCENFFCAYYAVCLASTPTTPTCVCLPCIDHQAQPICGVNGVTYQCRCEYEYAVCMAQMPIPTRKLGGCKPFVLERGRVALRLNTTDVQCKTVLFKEAEFESSRGSVYVQTSINYFNYSGNFIHDAAVTWVENVNIHTFEVCALKAGRAERLTPDGGLTFVDFVAFQESPVGAITGQLQMPSSWWDGTTCKTVAFEKAFSDVPYVLLTAEHKVLGQKHDAATVWVENARKSGFTACSREMQNFDGLHENIALNWIAYNSLLSELSAEEKFVDFPNSNLPKAGYHNAYCEDVKFDKTYSSTPTVIVSACHSSGEGSWHNVKPEYNSIAPWVEHINITDYRVCIKELHNPNGYDPVKVATMMIGE